MTVKLFKNAKVDGITRLGKWSSKSEQTAYFDTLVSKNYSTISVGLGEKLRIHEKLNNLLGYGYGFIDYGDGFRYYFSVADLIFVTETMTEIAYTIDCYDTAITQTNVSLARATITRYPQLISGDKYPFTPTYISYDKRMNPIRYALCFTFTETDGKQLLFGVLTYIPGGPAGITVDSFMRGIQNGTWVEWLNNSQNTYKFTASDIWMASVIPMFGDPLTGVFDSVDFIDADPTGSYAPYYNTKNNKFWVSKYNADCPLVLTSDAIDSWGVGENSIIEYGALKDCRGNTVYSFEEGTSYVLKEMTISFSASSIDLKVKYLRDSTDDVIATIPGETIDVYVDNWREYYYRQRQGDIDLRQSQINQQFWSSMVSLGDSAMQGIASGGLAGLSAKQGGGIGAGSGLISTVGTYVVNSYYGDKEQKIVDRNMKLSNDSLNQRGNNLSSILDLNLAGPCIESWDASTAEIHDEESLRNGYYVYRVVKSFADYLTVGAITADIEVLGDIPVAWKEQIHSRFASGVMIV